MLTHRERHRYTRVGWLRAAVLGADDGIVSTASLMIGVAASSASRNSILVAGLAGLVAGAGSMATGEFVSVSSQRDAERADIAKEKRELVHDPESELVELTHIYMERGLDRDLARQVATQLHANNPLEAHLRDELGMTDATGARPFQAAFVSAGTFALGAAVPVLALLVLRQASGPGRSPVSRWHCSHSRARSVLASAAHRSGVARVACCSAVASPWPSLR